MLLSRLAETSAALAATRSRLAKRDLIAAVLAGTAPEEVEVVISYLSGSLRQRRTGVGWRTLQDAPPPAAEPSLTVAEVDAAFAAVAGLAGTGSAAARTAAVRDLFGRATAAEQRLLAGLVSGELRQGALEAQVQEGLAAAFGVPVAAVRRAAMLTSSTTTAARLLAGGGLPALEAVGLRVGTAVQPMLAAAAPGPEAAAERSGLPAVVDAKLDGVRVQVHRDGHAVSVFTRSLDDITARLPDVVAVARSLPHERLVLDGEVLALRDDGTPEAFQVVASRTMSATDPAPGGRPLRVFFFDLLHVDGRDLLDEPLHERLAVMETVVPAALRVPRRTCADVAGVATAFAEAVAQGYEGVVVKNLDAPYAAGRRDAGWVKVKPRHTFDLAVVGAEWGHGRRQGWLSNLHLAARDPATGGFVMLGKTFKGLTDELLGWQTEQLLAREVRRTPGTVHVDPPLVVEIAVDGLQASTRYPGGVALRFARVLRYRPDKTPDEVDTLDTVRALGGPLRAGEEQEG
ncbi:ATP-dependent DNA ligase [Microlunatus capsulatus]|uniref:DNA ligase n=1 Tax=Microlunatus capsulatus TaxID=99117 RepID=A0ABS4Z659_9ACTN|nr:ATP-dependent DNA ligase [Microlunatus capsulatus]MBP2416530.1 DNA ligase-1 [Microlunatus capsulatus]